MLEELQRLGKQKRLEEQKHLTEQKEFELQQWLKLEQQRLGKHQYLEFNLASEDLQVVIGT